MQQREAESQRVWVGMLDAERAARYCEKVAESPRPTPPRPAPPRTGQGEF